MIAAPRVPLMAARSTAIIPRAPRDATTVRANAPRASPYGAAPSFPAASTPRAAGADASASSTEPTVEELMDPNAPVLREDTPLRDAARLFLQSNTQSAPVVDSSGALVGVLSESDLILKSSAVPEDHWLLPPVYIGVLDATLSLRDEAAWRGEVEKILARDVGHAMTRGGGKAGKGGGKAASKGQQALITAAPHEAVGVAAGRMAHHRVNMLPVVDGEGRVVGTLTRHDVLRGLYATQNPLL
jgi:CBS domain-containing protein